MWKRNEIVPINDEANEANSLVNDQKSNEKSELASHTQEELN